MHNELLNSPIFENIDAEHLKKFLSVCSKKIQIKRADILCRQYELGDSMYLLESGKLEILIDTPTDKTDTENVSRIIANIESGAVIGEMCVFGQKKRSATIRASEDAELYVIEGKVFRQLIQAQEIGALLISYNIAKLLSQRLMNANEFIRQLDKKYDRPEFKSELEYYRERFFDESLFN